MIEAELEKLSSIRTINGDAIELLSSEELKVAIAAIQAELANREQEELEQARQDILKICQKVGLAADEILRPVVKPKKVGVPAPVKYRNPNNPDETWSGRGKRPIWFKNMLESGYEPEQLAA